MSDSPPPSNLFEVERPVILFGCTWGCGATLLQRLLNSAGDAMIWGESGRATAALRAAYDALVDFAGQNADQAAAFREKGLEAWIPNLNPPAPASLDGLRALYLEFFARPAHHLGKTRWGLKQISDGARVGDFLAQLFPAACGVLILRNPVDCLASVAPLPWYDKVGRSPAVIQTWFDNVTWLTEPDNRMLTVRYEELVASPETELARICEHSGIPLERIDRTLLPGCEETTTPPPLGLMESWRLRRPRLVKLAADVGYDVLGHPALAAARPVSQADEDRRDDSTLADAERPVFIFGCAWRCGSTLLQRLLMSTGEVMVWGETGGVSERFNQAYMALLDSSTRQADPEGHAREPGVATAMDPDVNPPPPAPSEAMRTFYQTYFGSNAERLGKHRWGFKEVFHGAEVAAFLGELFPGSRSVFLLRNPVDCLASAATIGWYDKVGRSEGLLRTWVDNTSSLTDERDHRLLTVRYEDLVAQPEAELSRVSEHVGIPFERFDLSLLSRPVRGAAVPPALGREEARRLRSPELVKLAASVGYDVPAHPKLLAMPPDAPAPTPGPTGT